MTTRLTVLGATGGTGRQLVRQALEAGHEVTAVVRDPARLAATDERLTTVTADVTDADALCPAIEGRDAVLSALGASSDKQAAATAITSRGTHATLAAMESCGVQRLVTISAAPVGPTPVGEGMLGRVAFAVLRRVLRNSYADMAVMEKAVRDSGLEWTIMRPPQLLDKPLTATYERVLGGAVPRHHRIPRADLAHAMLSALEDPTTVRQIVGVAS